MPRRTNIFQQVVAIIHQHIAGDADLQESVMLRNRLTGKEQEVDVVIRSQPAGHEVIVSIEATDRGRKADVQWVQQMVGKHADLPTSKLVLVSSAGFTSDARTAAVENGAAALAVEDLDADDPDQAVLQALHSLWPRHITVSARQVQLLVRTPAGRPVAQIHTHRHSTPRVGVPGGRDSSPLAHPSRTCSRTRSRASVRATSAA